MNAYFSNLPFGLFGGDSIMNNQYPSGVIHRKIEEPVAVLYILRFARRCEFTERGWWDIESPFIVDYWILAYSILDIFKLTIHIYG